MKLKRTENFQCFDNDKNEKINFIEVDKEHLNYTISQISNYFKDLLHFDASKLLIKFLKQ